MSRNTKISGTMGLTGFLEELRSRLPTGWTAIRRGRGNRIEIRSSGGESAPLEVRVESELTPRDAQRIVADREDLPILVFARFLSASARSRLREAGASYADTTGNWCVELEAPGLFLRTDGADRDPSPQKRPLLSLKGPAAGRAVRALCDFLPPYGIRELAQRAEIPLGSLSRVVNLLDESALIEREPRGPILQVAITRLIERWTEDYSVLESNGSSTWLAPRGLDATIQAANKLKTKIAITGSFGARPIIAAAPARLLMAYTTDTDALAKKLKLIPAEVGANVILLEPFDQCAMERTWVSKGPRIVRHSQMAADLLTSPGRGPEEGERLLEWMEANQDEWRS